jgi:hypothetical protein
VEKGAEKSALRSTGQSTGQRGAVRWQLSGGARLSGERDREVRSTGQSRVECTGHARCHGVLSGG